jgi:hypothetical protein
VDDDLDFIAEGGRVGAHFNRLFKAGQELAGQKEVCGYYHSGENGKLVIHTPTTTDLGKMAEFIEVNILRWSRLDWDDELPGQDSARDRKFPVSALPGTEEAERTFPAIPQKAPRLTREEYREMKRQHEEERYKRYANDKTFTAERLANIARDMTYYRPPPPTTVPDSPEPTAPAPGMDIS